MAPIWEGVEEEAEGGIWEADCKESLRQDLFLVHPPLGWPEQSTRQALSTPKAE